MKYFHYVSKHIKFESECDNDEKKAFECCQKLAKLSKTDVAYMVGHCNRMQVEDEVDVEDNVRMMYVKRINKGIKSIKRSSAIMTCKIDVGKEKIDKNKIKNAMVSSVNDKFAK
ncbi:hypothetical protein F8M41_021557 [Gigaspora margarita]|uniref:Uncharacterized protein n=1 Tax=Gigaspora margarita TaxID=4874 RepID=A0A8H4AGI0_GIGMA|nr:hypothetical protein F8M41_021557 [Gigaspora margarita]